MASPPKDFSAALEQREGNTLVRVKAVPGSSRSIIAGVLGDRIKVRVAAAPEGGRANEAILGLISASLHLPRSAVSIVSGTSRPQKTLLVAGLTPDSVESLLRAAIKD